VFAGLRNSFESLNRIGGGSHRGRIPRWPDDYKSIECELLVAPVWMFFECLLLSNRRMGNNKFSTAFREHYQGSTAAGRMNSYTVVFELRENCVQQSGIDDAGCRRNIERRRRAAATDSAQKGENKPRDRAWSAQVVHHVFRST